MPIRFDRSDHQRRRRGWRAGSVALLNCSLALGVIVGCVWGCGADQPYQPAATSSLSRSDSFQPAPHDGGADSVGSMTNSANPEKEQQAMAFQQQVQETDPADLQNVLLDGVASPNPDIQLMALNGLEPMLSWNAQTRSELETMMRYETDPGMRRRMEDLLAKEVSPILQPADGGAVPN